VVIISGHGNIEIAVAAIKQGAYDFIEKPFNIDQLAGGDPPRDGNLAPAPRERELRRKDVRATAEMIGSSAAIRALKSQLDKVTKSNGRVMLTGPAGLGQGGGGALHPRPFQPRGRALRHGLLRLDRARPHGGGALRAREPRARGGTGPAGTGAWRRHLFRRGRRHAAGTQSKILRVLVDQSFTRVGGNGPRCGSICA
jgi:two-component system, NtrC family, nitrogen regulation response regulator NtrX